jgi:hypothetical protein
MEEAGNTLDLEGSRYILDDERVVLHHMRILPLGDDDGLRRERVMHRVQDAADLASVGIDVALRGLGGVATGCTENMSMTAWSVRMPPVSKGLENPSWFTPAGFTGTGPSPMM